MTLKRKVNPVLSLSWVGFKKFGCDIFNDTKMDSFSIISLRPPIVSMLWSQEVQIVTLVLAGATHTYNPKFSQ